jgi:hypothetical protein
VAHLKTEGEGSDTLRQQKDGNVAPLLRKHTRTEAPSQQDKTSREVVPQNCRRESTKETIPRQRDQPEVAATKSN